MTLVGVHVLFVILASALLIYGVTQMARLIIADIKRDPLAEVNDTISDRTVLAQSILIAVGLGLVVLCQLT